MNIDPTLFRKVMGQFATGVTIITTKDSAEEPIGLTVNSFTSLSLSPPLVLFCLAKSAGSHQTFVESPAFVVNILAADQQDLSNRFARHDQSERWRGTLWQAGPATGVPVLAGCCASLECRRHSVLEGGDHSILVGEVVALVDSAAGSAGPLLYFAGGYRTLADC